MNSKTIQLETFHNNILKLKKQYQIKILGNYIYQISPISVINDKNYLTLMALVHGNENGNLFVFEQFLRLLSSSVVKLNVTITLALGNYQAFLKDKRFLEKDLNRSFNINNPKSLEELRAQELSTVLKETKYLIDFHQTIEKCDRGFFIFPYNKKSFDFAQKVHPDLDIITHWKNKFSQDGMCSDEFTNSHNGTGITVETGQQGYNNFQVALGLQIILNALNLNKKPASTKGKIFTWAQTINYPQQEDVKLCPNIVNFSKVQAGDIIGFSGKKEIIAEENGWILFPKYPKKNEPRPKELCRILKEINTKDLPQ
jgi:succinylglutamate desuccinylase